MSQYHYNPSDVHALQIVFPQFLLPIIYLLECKKENVREN